MPAAAFGRLRVDGATLRQPDGRSLTLRGVNLQFRLDSAYGRVHPWDDELVDRLRTANVVRLVALHWNDNKGDSDCRTAAPPYISERCLALADEALSWATRHGLWAIVTLRGEKAANSVFKDKAQQRELFAAWQATVSRWRGKYLIAAYEPLSEPRVSRDEIWWVKSFYEKACGALAQADPDAACMVGSTPYYSRADLDQVVVPHVTNTHLRLQLLLPKSVCDEQPRRRVVSVELSVLRRVHA